MRNIHIWFCTVHCEHVTIALLCIRWILSNFWSGFCWLLIINYLLSHDPRSFLSRTIPYTVTAPRNAAQWSLLRERSEHGSAGWVNHSFRALSSQILSHSPRDFQISLYLSIWDTWREVLTYFWTPISNHSAWRRVKMQSWGVMGEKPIFIWSRDQCSAKQEKRLHFYSRLG